MTEIKTKATKESVTKFLSSIKPDDKRKDALTLLAIFKKITGEKPVMWGTSIVGFGKYHYKSDKSAQEGDWFHVGFSPRKQNLTLYILAWKMEDPKLLSCNSCPRTKPGSNKGRSTNNTIQKRNSGAQYIRLLLSAEGKSGVNTCKDNKP